MSFSLQVYNILNQKFHIYYSRTGLALDKKKPLTDEYREKHKFLKLQFPLLVVYLASTFDFIMRINYKQSQGLE